MLEDLHDHVVVENDCDDSPLTSAAVFAAPGSQWCTSRILTGQFHTASILDAPMTDDPGMPSPQACHDPLVLEY